ncbi:MAG: nickel pincer cofactor biosynthesis protein LarB [Chloroflexota bacterium]|nr:nickel pincer cofactor biosynthesis protein LarB [Chloroflexota bacterium]
MDPFEDLIAGLEAAPAAPSSRDARLDPRRRARKGVPEVVYAPGKTPAQIERLTSELIASTGRVIVSRPSPELRESLLAVYAPSHSVTGSWSLAIEDPARSVVPTGGRVGIVTAGSSDLPWAEEAMLVAQHMGCVTSTVYDVGVAGLHRLFPPLRGLLEDGVDAIVVAAGMDGALPSVVAGLVNVPVIGLPTSTGYGAGGNGQAALLSMLQTCSPGLAVVNIDNGVGAGAMAALIANRVAEAREGNRGDATAR